MTKINNLNSQENQRIYWKPQPKQSKALERNEDEILYGGARGGGKTDAGIVWLLYYIDKPYYRALVIRRNSTDLSDWIDRASRIYNIYNGRLTGNPPSFIFPSGAIIRTGHLKDDTTYTKYQGHEYHRILIEELTQIPTEERYLKLISSNRSTSKEIKPQVFCTTNPGEVGHDWVKDRWRIDSTKWGVPFVGSDSKRRIFIHATVEDNPYLADADPGYIKFLEGLPDGLREQWRHGSWDDIEIGGSYYGAMINQAASEGRITDVPVIDSYPVHTAWDIGIDDATAIWFYQIHQTQIRLIDYIQDSQKSLKDYFRLLQNKPYLYGFHYFPHDIKTRHKDSGKETLEIIKKIAPSYNFKVVPKITVMGGIIYSRILLSRCWFDKEKCKQGIRALKNYRKEWDEKKSTYKPTPLHDWASHGADAFRYLAVGLNENIPSRDTIYIDKQVEQLDPFT